MKVSQAAKTWPVCPPGPAPCCNSRTAPWLLYASTKKNMSPYQTISTLRTVIL